MQTSPRWIHAAAAALVLAVYFAVATTATRSKSNTFDEIAHLTAGYTYWSYNDYRLQPENGNWSQRLGGLAAVLDEARFPDRDNAAWRGSDVYAIGDRFFFQSGNDLDRLLFRARATIAVLGVFLGAIVFAWSWRLNGAAGAWTSLVLFSFCPTMLAHGAMVTSDMAAALAFTAFAGSWWSLLHRITPARLAVSTLAACTVLLSKFSGPVLVPIAVTLVVIRLVRGGSTDVVVAGWARSISGRGQMTIAAAGLALAHAVIAAVVIWASYGFRYSAFASADANTRLLVDWTLVTSGGDASSTGPGGAIVNWARERELLPEAYLYGMAHSLKFAQARRAFMDGEYSLTGWHTFFPYAFAVKTTVPLVALLAVSLWVAWRRRARSAPSSAGRFQRAYEHAPLLTLIAIYSAVAVVTSLNIGHRHLLPIYPALIILAGGAGALLIARERTSETSARGSSKNKRRGQAVAIAPVALSHASLRRMRAPGLAVIALLLWQATATALVYPHFLAYFNELAGGPAQGYRHLVDSSLDWGQDLPGLKRWLDDQGLQRTGHAPVYLSYFGSASPAHYGIDAVTLLGYFDRRQSILPPPITGGWYCVSATMLQGVYLDPMGDWSQATEARYQELREPTEAFLSALRTGNEQQLAAMAGQAGQQFWTDAITRYDRLRTARLLAYLRQRTPTTNVGYSILIYQLSDREAAEAVAGPPPYRR